MHKPRIKNAQPLKPRERDASLFPNLVWFYFHRMFAKTVCVCVGGWIWKSRINSVCSLVESAFPGKAEYCANHHHQKGFLSLNPFSTQSPFEPRSVKLSCCRKKYVKWRKWQNTKHFLWRGEGGKFGRQKVTTDLMNFNQRWWGSSVREQKKESTLLVCQTAWEEISGLHQPQNMASFV